MKLLHYTIAYKEGRKNKVYHTFAVTQKEAINNLLKNHESARVLSVEAKQE